MRTICCCLQYVVVIVYIRLWFWYTILMIHKIFSRAFCQVFLDPWMLRDERWLRWWMLSVEVVTRFIWMVYHMFWWLDYTNIVCLLFSVFFVCFSYWVAVILLFIPPPSWTPWDLWDAPRRSCHRQSWTHGRRHQSLWHWTSRPRSWGSGGTFPHRSVR